MESLMRPRLCETLRDELCEIGCDQWDFRKERDTAVSFSLFPSHPSTLFLQSHRNFIPGPHPQSFSDFLSVSVTVPSPSIMNRSALYRQSPPIWWHLLPHLSPTSVAASSLLLSSDLMASVVLCITHLRGRLWVPRLYRQISLENVSGRQDTGRQGLYSSCPRGDMKSMTVSKSHGGKVRRKVNDARWSVRRCRTSLQGVTV